MYQSMRFTERFGVDVVERESPPCGRGQVRVRTLYSGISAGTELTAYRGTNPYLNSVWNPDLTLFDPGSGEGPAYPLEAWGYSEVGRIVEAGDEVVGVHVGDVVWGIWGHRSEAVLEAAAVAGHVLPGHVDPLAGSFVRVGSIALNAVLAAQLAPGMAVAVIGQGVIGLLATRFAALNGATVYAVDTVPERRELAVARYGAVRGFAPCHEVAREIRGLTGGLGADVAIEVSGNVKALHEATRIVGREGLVVATGFYQGDASGLMLGEEFHHNRVTIRSSQIGAVPAHLAARWDRDRLQRVVAEHLAAGDPDAARLVTHRFRLDDAADAYRLLDRPTPDVLQVVFDFTD